MVSIFDRAAADGIGFRYGVSLGNQVDLEICDFLDYMVAEPHTAALCVYVEGLLDGARFRRSLAAARAAGKPVLVVKTGRTQAGVKSARSHTASLAGAWEVFEAVCREEGAVLARDPDDMVRAAHFLVRHRAPRRGGVSILSSSGGGCGIASDRVSELGVPLATLTADSRAQLSELLLPPQADNPVDLGGRRKPEEIEIAGDVARILLERSRHRVRARHPHLDAVLRQSHALIGEAALAADKPVMIALTPGAAAEAPRQRAARARPVLLRPQRGRAARPGAGGRARRATRGAADAAHAAGRAAGCALARAPRGRADRGRGQAAARGVRRAGGGGDDHGAHAGGGGRRRGRRLGFPWCSRRCRAGSCTRATWVRCAWGSARRRGRPDRGARDARGAPRRRTRRRPRGLLGAADDPRRGRGDRGRPARSALRRRRHGRARWHRGRDPEGRGARAGAGEHRAGPRDAGRAAGRPPADRRARPPAPGRHGHRRRDGAGVVAGRRSRRAARRSGSQSADRPPGRRGRRRRRWSRYPAAPARRRRSPVHEPHAPDHPHAGAHAADRRPRRRAERAAHRAQRRPRRARSDHQPRLRGPARLRRAVRQALRRHPRPQDRPAARRRVTSGRPIRNRSSSSCAPA